MQRIRCNPNTSFIKGDDFPPSLPLVFFLFLYFPQEKRFTRILGKLLGITPRRCGSEWCKGHGGPCHMLPQFLPTQLGGEALCL